MNSKNHLAWMVASVMALIVNPALSDDLFSAGHYDPLAADHRALRVGDNLTVIVTEIASATTDARTSADKDGSLSGSATVNQVPQRGTFNLNETFTGGGKIERSGKLLARMTVAVQTIDSNGDLHVKGQQEIVINGDRQKLMVEGRVRPQDVGADNTVLSSRLSDSRISYIGDGVLAEKQRSGLLTRLLSWLRIL